MTSIIKVDQIQKTDGSDFEFGGGVGSVVQKVVQPITAQSSCSTTAGTKSLIPDYTATITPKYANSKILVEIRWMGEFGVQDNTYNGIFGIYNGTSYVGMPDGPDGSRNVGVSVPTLTYHAANAATTTEAAYLSAIDEPNTTSPITYQLYFMGYLSMTMYNNRTVQDSNDNGQERGTSLITLTEIRQQEAT